MNKHMFRNNDSGTTRKVRLSVWMLLIPFFISGLTAYAHSKELSDAVKARSEVVDSQQQSKQRKIIGVVVDPSGEPVIGAAVTVQSQGGAKGTITNVDGRFEITGPATAFKIEISYMGFKKKVVDISAGQNRYNIQLEEDSQLLDEVVVVGFGVQKKETVTGAISMVQTKDLVQSPQANVPTPRIRKVE